MVPPAPASHDPGHSPRLEKMKVHDLPTGTTVSPAGRSPSSEVPMSTAAGHVQSSVSPESLNSIPPDRMICVTSVPVSVRVGCVVSVTSSLCGIRGLLLKNRPPVGDTVRRMFPGEINDVAIAELFCMLGHIQILCVEKVTPTPES